MKKLFVSLISVVCGIYAATTNTNTHKKSDTKIYGFEHFYYASLSDNAKRKLTRTPKYKEALSLYYDTKNYKPEKIIYKENGKRRSKNVAFPDFKKVEETFLQSYTEEYNKAAGFMAAYVHKTYGDTYTLKGQLKYFHIVSALAKDGNCFGYLETAKYFSQGIADIAKSPKQAVNILKVAQKKCSKSVYALNIEKELLLHKNGFYETSNTEFTSLQGSNISQ